MKIVVLDGYSLNPGDLSWDGFKMLGDVTVYDRTLPSEVIERIGDAEIVITNKVIISKEILARTQIKYIGVLATGYNVVDVQAAKALGVIVTNIPTYGTDAVAQYVFALLLELCHRVGAHDQSVKDGQWSSAPDFCYWNYPMMELVGKTIGIVGFGKIGRRTADIAKAFGMNVIVFNRSRRLSHLSEGMAYVELDELLEKSDVISLHLPLFDSTKGIINKESIGKMKDGVILINTGRGPLIVEEDLAEALVSGKVRGAAVDVVSVEPINEANPLLKAPNMIITPHIAWAPREARERLLNTAVHNLAAFLAGHPENVV